MSYYDDDGEGGGQFALYTVRPNAAWRALAPNEALTKGALASLTTFMRETLYAAMIDAVVETQRTSRLRSRRGAIYRQIRTGLRAYGSGLPGTVSAAFMFKPWMAIHETGGTIEPREVQYLTVPLRAALRADGRLKRRSASGWSSYKTFVLTAKSGKKYLVYRDKRTRKLVFLYALVEQVKIKRRLRLKEAILRREDFVVAAWKGALLDIVNSIDIYGIAFEGLEID